MPSKQKPFFKKPSEPSSSEHGVSVRDWRKTVPASSASDQPTVAVGVGDESAPDALSEPHAEACSGQQTFDVWPHEMTGPHTL